MEEELSNTSIPALLAEYTELVQDTVKTEMPREAMLQLLADTLKQVTDELQTYCSNWKTATQQAEDGAKQMAQGNKEIEEMKKKTAEEDEKLEERKKKMEKAEEQLSRREFELEVKERLFENKKLEQERKEKFLEQQSMDLERTRLTSTIQHAQLQSEAAIIQSKESKVVQELHIFQAKVEASKEADIRRTNWEEGLRKREENLKLTYQSVLALNDTVNKKRGLDPGSSEQQVSKRHCHRRRSSVGSAGMLTSFGPLEPLPEDILARIPYGDRVIRPENLPRDNDTSPSRTASTTSGAPGPLESSVALQSGSSLMDPATATGQITTFNPESSSPRTLLQSSQSNASVTDPTNLTEASDEVKDVWRQIEFPENWNLSASNTLLQGLQRATNKDNQPKSRPAGLLDSSSARPNCFLCRVSKAKSGLDNGNKPCSNCKLKGWPCVRVSFVAEGLTNAEYDQDGQEKRWRLTIRED